MLQKDNNPWLGLASYEYSDAYRFFGREKELAHLKQVIDHSAVTTIYGISGAGKTSLINAGLSPLLEKSGYLPVRIRLDHNVQLSYSEQIIQAIQQAIQAIGGEIEANPSVDFPMDDIPEAERLWFFLHTSSFWTKDNHHIIPVIFIDQFEEIFTQEISSNALQAFFQSIHLLQYNMPPQGIADILEQQEGYADLSGEVDIRLVLVLREDFLARLEDYSYDIPALRKNRVGVKRMNGLQAIEVIRRPSDALVKHTVALRIISKVAGQPVHDNPSYLEQMSIDTSLLSLFCSELYEKAVKQKLNELSDGLIDEFGEDILSSFYDDAMALVYPSTAEYLEDHLLTLSGFRNSMAVEDLVTNEIRQDELQILSKKRLIRIETANGTERVEFTHDVLCSIAKRHRDQRKEQVTKRSNLKQTIGLGIECIVATFMLFIVTLSKWGMRYIGEQQTGIQAWLESNDIINSQWLLLIALCCLVGYIVFVLPLKANKDRFAMHLFLLSSVINGFASFYLFGWLVMKETLVYCATAWFTLIPFFNALSTSQYPYKQSFKDFLLNHSRWGGTEDKFYVRAFKQTLDLVLVAFVALFVHEWFNPTMAFVCMPIVGAVAFHIFMQYFDVSTRPSFNSTWSLPTRVVSWTLVAISPLIPYGILGMAAGWAGLLFVLLMHTRPRYMLQSIVGWAIGCVILPYVCLGYNIFKEYQYGPTPNGAITCTFSDKTERYMIITDGHYQGVRDRHNIILPVDFDKIQPDLERSARPWEYSYQLTAIRNDQKEIWAFPNNPRLISSQQLESTIYYRGFRVIESNGKYGIVDENDRWILAPDYDKIVLSDSLLQWIYNGEEYELPMDLFIQIVYEHLEEQ